MKVAICKFEHYFLSENLMDILKVNDERAFEDDRNNELLVNTVESIIKKGDICSLKVVDLPDDITDWEIERHDRCGCHREQIIYIREGKIYRAY